MKFLRYHWYDLGGVISIFVLLFVFIQYDNLTHFQILMWLNLVSLFFHQLEEYRIVGTFPGMVNGILAGKNNTLPDRYPLNTNSAFVVNVIAGWLIYFAAAILAETAIWLGMATILISMANVIAHTVFFNIKGKTWYNAGLASSWLFFVPCIYYFFDIIHSENLVSNIDYIIGIPLGIIFNYFGILKIIDLLKDKNTQFVFEQRNLLKKDRISS